MSPTGGRKLGGLDFAVLWGDLSVGILVLYTGAILAAGMALPAAAAAILLGSLIGCLPLAAVSAAGARSGLPTMALFRPVLGARGARVPAVLNVLQLVGWAAFEFWAIAQIADAVAGSMFGIDLYPVWLVSAAILCTALALAGPVRVVHRWLERFGIYALIAAGVWLTIRTLASGGLGTAWDAPGGAIGFWAGVDLVIAMPISWLPLAADYGRFARDPKGAAVGTYAGYLVGNVWFFALGALLVVLAGAPVSVLGIGGTLIGLGGGIVVLLVLLVGETDGAFANVYSASISLRTAAPRAPARGSIVGIGAVALVLAAAIGTSAETFELFLLTIGSVFVPLFGVWFGIAATGAPATTRRFDIAAVAAWAAGFCVFHWSSPSPLPAWAAFVERLFTEVGLPFPLLGGRLGASIPSAILAFGLGVLIGLRRRTTDPTPVPAAGRSRSARPTGSRRRSPG